MWNSRDFILANKLNMLIGDNFSSVKTEILQDRQSRGFSLHKQTFPNLPAKRKVCFADTSFQITTNH